MLAEITPIPAAYDRHNTLEELVEVSQAAPMPDYPPPERRWPPPEAPWPATPEDWQEVERAGVLVLPDGPWHVHDHPGREAAKAKGAVLDPDIVNDQNPIDPTRLAAWRERYPIVTDRGLPVHPFTKLVTAELPNGARLRMATGVGRERYYGAIDIGNLACLRRSTAGELEYAVVTTIRDGKRRVSFPGGYVEKGKTIADAGFSESDQEAGLMTACDRLGITRATLEQQPNVFWELKPSVIGPCTVNTWLAEHFLMVDASGIEEMRGILLATQDPEEVKALGWRSWQALLNEPAFMAAHRRALEAHIELLGIKETAL